MRSHSVLFTSATALLAALAKAETEGQLTDRLLLQREQRCTNSGDRCLARAVERSDDPAAHDAAINALVPVLDSNAVIGGMEVRMMAVAAMEKIGRDATQIGTKAKAMGLVQAYSTRNNWEPEARRRAQEAASRIEASMKQP